MELFDHHFVRVKLFVCVFICFSFSKRRAVMCVHGFCVCYFVCMDTWMCGECWYHKRSLIHHHILKAGRPVCLTLFVWMCACVFG